MSWKCFYDNAGKLAEYKDDKLVWLRAGYKPNSSGNTGPMIMRDIEPYKNMIDGRMITSRSEHRELLKRHNCVEVGNDTSHMKKKPFKAQFKDRKKVLASQLADKSDSQISQMIKTEIKRRTH